MLTTWVLVITMMYDRSATMTIVPNLKDFQECKRIEKVMQDRANSQRFYTYCMETINK